MWILAMESTGPVASVALINEKLEIKNKAGEKGYNHLTSLIPMTKDLLEENDLTPQDLTAVAASVGPGSFTGIRIGVSSARALSQSLGIPCLRVPTLQTFLYNENYYMRSADLKENSKLICPILDARRDQLYGAAFYKGQGLVEEGAYSLLDFLSRIDDLKMEECEALVFYGDGITRYSEQISFWANSRKIRIFFTEEKQRYQSAVGGAIIAKEQWEKGNHLSYNQLVPEYMRIPEAQRKLKNGSLHV